MAHSSSSQAQDLKDEWQVSKYVTIAYSRPKNTAVVTFNASYIPRAELEKALNELKNNVPHDGLQKLILDQRKLVAYHQPSAEWFYLHWMEEMSRSGLKQVRILLPEDESFVKQDAAGLKQISRENPWYDLDRYDISYSSSVQEALEK